MTNEMKIASVYIRFSGDDNPTIQEMLPYLELAEQYGSALATASIIQDGIYGQTLFNDELSTREKVIAVFQGLFNRNPLEEGLNYWIDQFENNNSYVNSTSLVQSVLRGAEVNEDQTDWSFVQSYSLNHSYDLEVLNSELNTTEEDIEEKVEEKTPVIEDELPTDNSIKQQNGEYVTIDLVGLETPVFVEHIIHTDMDADGTIDYSEEFEYSFKDGLIYSTSDLISYPDEAFKVDSNGNIIEDYNYDENGDLTDSTIYTFNSQNQILTANTEDADGVNYNLVNTWTNDSVISNVDISYMGMNYSVTGIGTGLNSLKDAPIKWEIYIDDELQSTDYFTYDSNGNEIEDREDEDGDGTIDYIYITEWALLV